MIPFHFQGTIPASKSVLNRCLLLQSYEPSIKIHGDSQCDDVQAMRMALKNLAGGKHSLHCGEAALVFRLIALAASRKTGTFQITGSPRLLSRPHAPLLKLLNDLGVSARLTPDALEIKSDGWRQPKAPLDSGAALSSQFASAILLNSWGLPFELKFSMPENAVSLGYFEISLALAHQSGLKFTREPSLIRIPAFQKISATSLEAESDLSSAFAVAALAAIAGKAEITNFPSQSLQPDRIFVDILQAMGILITRTHQTPMTLTVDRPEKLHPIDWNLRDSPDLFPVLGTLCAFANGKSRLHGAPHLAHKESDRIAGLARLLTHLHREYRRLPDGIEIEGRPPRSGETPPFDFDPDHDHRLAMAAAIAHHAGYPIRVAHLNVLSKSFPEFRNLARFEEMTP